MYKIKYLKYKNKYLTLKNQLGGSINHLDETMNTEIAKINDCKDIINKLSVNKQQDINFDQLPRPINTTLDLRNPNRSTCSHISDPVKRAKCNQYYNECYLKNLYRKYFPGSPEPVTYNVDTLNSILLRTIPNNNLDLNRNGDQSFLIVIGANLTHIPSHAFYNRQLRYISIPSSITHIDECAFYGNQLTQVLLPNSVEHIGESAFQNNQISYISMSSSLTHIGNDAFSNNLLSRVTIPDSVRVIGHFAFSENQLLNLILPDGIETIGERAFMGNRLSQVKIPKSVTNIGDGAFAGNQIRQVTIPRRFGNHLGNIFDGSHDTAEDYDTYGEQTRINFRFTN